MGIHENKFYTILMNILISFFLVFTFTGITKTFSQDKLKILFLGDSLTEGYGVAKENSYPQVVKSYLEKKGVKLTILNGSVSGSTTASGPSRIKWFLKAKPDILFLALGANDGLRGISISTTKKNLEETIAIGKKGKMDIVLAGMMVPPNYGPEYGTAFKTMFSTISKKKKVHFLPFLLEGVAGEKKFNQEDGIHPNEKGHKKMGKLVGEFLIKNLNIKTSKK